MDTVAKHFETSKNVSVKPVLGAGATSETFQVIFISLREKYNPMFRCPATGRVRCDESGWLWGGAMTGSDRQKAAVVNEPDARWIVCPGHGNGDSDWSKVAVIDSVPAKGRREPPKHVYRLSHNGERFARCKEFKLFAERFPEAVPAIEAAMFGESQSCNSNKGDRP